MPSILAAPTVSLPALSRRDRSDDGGPNGMVGVPALIPETFSCSFSKLHRAQARKAEVIEHARDAPLYAARAPRPRRRDGRARAHLR